jgi:hypothetical protein
MGVGCYVILLLFRPDAVNIPAGKGVFSIHVDFPPYLFNRGVFYVTVIIGNKEKL